MKKSEITKDQIRWLQDQLGRTNEGMANIVGTTEVTWSRWRSGATTPLPVFRDKLEKLLRFAGYGRET